MPIILFVLMAGGIGVGVYRQVVAQRQHLKQDAGRALAAIADLKIKQIVSWRDEQVRVGRTIQEALTQFAQPDEWINKPDGDPSRRKVLGWLNRIRGWHGYSDVQILSREGGEMYSVAAGRRVKLIVRKYLAEAIQGNEVLLTDLHGEEDREAAHVDVIVPLRGRGPRVGLVVGALALQIRWDDFLDPLIKPWPTPSQSGETLLVRREGDTVVYLNDVRHQPGTGLRLRLPVTTPELPAGMAVQGKGGLAEGMDYRRVPVLAVTRPVPDTNWWLVAKEDQEEVFRPLSRENREAVEIGGLIVALTGMMLLFLWWTLTTRNYRRLLEARTRQRTVLDTSLDGYCVFDGEWRVLEANYAMSRLSGYPAEELTGMRMDSLDAGMSVDEQSQMRGQLKEQGAAQFETRIRRKDGRLVDVEVSASRPEQQGSEYHAFVRDITERKRGEAKLKESERRLRLTLERVPLMALQLAPDGTALFVNESVERITGWSSKELLGAKWFEMVIPKEHLGRFSELYLAAARERSAVTSTIAEIVTKDGQRRTISWNSTVDLDMQGEVISTTWFGEDMTEWLRLQTELLTAQRLDSLSRLAGGVAHDFNNLLTVVNGYSDLLIGRLSDGDKNRILVQEIGKAGRRAADLTQQLLAFSRKGTGQLEPVDLNRVVREELPLLATVLGETVKVEFHEFQELPPAMGHGGRIQQVLMNLALNARDAMPEGGQFTVETRHAGGRSDVCLTIKDTGSGMTDEVKRHLFEPFYTTKPVGQGTGLGLSTVYGIVGQLGGTIRVESEVGRGTQFEIRFPIADQATTPAGPEGESVGNLGGNEVVLLVEDQADVRQLEALALSMNGYQVLEAADGMGALEILKAEAGRVDLLVTDIVMPGMDGLQLADEVQCIRPGLPVLFTSGYQKGMSVQSRQWPMKTSFLAKPFTPEDLAAKIRELLAAAAQPRRS